MKFYDSSNAANYPHGQAACFYGDGRFAVTGAEVAAIGPPEHRMITVTGDGNRCSIIDGKPDNPLTPAQVRGFVRERKGRQQDAIIYCPRSWVAEYQAVLADFGHGDLGGYGGLYWWISTLDGVQWTPQTLAANLAAEWDATVDPSRIWAVQNNQLPEIGPGALVDQSELFLAWRP